MSPYFLTSFFFFLLASCVGSHINTYNSTNKYSETSFKRVGNEDWLNVKYFGAKGDGITDDSKAINEAISFLSKSEKSTLFFPKGTYLIDSAIQLIGSKLTILGSSPENTILEGKDVYNLLLTTGVIKDSLIVKNIQFKGEEVKSTVLKVLGESLKGELLVKNCIFYNAHLYNIWLEGVQNAKIADNVFRGSGNGKGTGIQIIDGCINIDIINNEFYYLFRGVYIIGYNYNNQQVLIPNTNITFEKNYLDFGWYLLPTRYGTEGENLNYTKNSVYDPDANFGKIPPKNNIRILKPLISGTITKNFTYQIFDSQANFLDQNIKRGDLIRIGNKQALVDSVMSNQTIQIENWVNKKNLSNVSPPKINAHYSIYRIIIGKIKNNSPHKITVWRFYDFYGDSYVPKNNWKYEVLRPRPNYPFFATKNNHDFLIKDNIFKRGWADQIAISGDKATIRRNVIKDGQDMGITLHGEKHIIANNTIIHQRTGVWLACENSIFKDNIIMDCGWASDYSETQEGIYLYVQRPGNRILNNDFTRKHVNYGFEADVIQTKKKVSYNSYIKENKFHNLKKQETR